MIRTLLLPCCLLAILQSVAVCQVPTYLDIQFLNRTSPGSGYTNDDIWINFDNGGSSTPFDVTYNGGTAVTFGTYTDGTDTLTNHLSDSIQLSSITDATFRVNSVSSVAVYITYGSAMTSYKASPSFFDGAPGADKLFQNFEITRTGGSGDQGNLTNINYFAAPLSIKSYSNTYDGGTTAVQTTSFNQTAAEIGKSLASLSSSNTSSAGGELKRYIGPSSWTTNPPYPSFDEYLQAVHTSGVTNKIVNSNAFNTDGSNGTNGKNYNYTLNFVSTVAADNTITLSGSIATQIKDNQTGIITPGPTYSNANVTISGTDMATLNSIIYGQTTSPFSGSVTFGSGWDDLAAFISDPSNDMTGSNAVDILKATSIGEITTAILMGFLGNTTEVGGTALDEMESRDWWQLDPMQAFSQISPDNTYYNEWAEIIYNASNNGAYGIPYSDRLGSGPLVNSVQLKLGDTDYGINKWEVEFFDPVSAESVPEPSSLLLLLPGAFFLLRRRVH